MSVMLFLERRSITFRRETSASGMQTDMYCECLHDDPKLELQVHYAAHHRWRYVAIKGRLNVITNVLIPE